MTIVNACLSFNGWVMVEHFGGCHCGAVKFRVQAPRDLRVIVCNCSICSKSGFLHLIVPSENFQLIGGQEYLTSYRFHTQTAQHLFCTVCGVKSFYVPRSHPNDWSVNVNCLDRKNIDSIEKTFFDGQHWEENISSIE